MAQSGGHSSAAIARHADIVLPAVGTYLNVAYSRLAMHWTPDKLTYHYVITFACSRSKCTIRIAHGSDPTTILEDDIVEIAVLRSKWERQEHKLKCAQDRYISALSEPADIACALLHDILAQFDRTRMADTKAHAGPLGDPVFAYAFHIRKLDDDTFSSQLCATEAHFWSAVFKAQLTAGQCVYYFRPSARASRDSGYGPEEDVFDQQRSFSTQHYTGHPQSTNTIKQESDAVGGPEKLLAALSIWSPTAPPAIVAPRQKLFDALRIWSPTASLGSVKREPRPRRDDGGSANVQSPHVVLPGMPGKALQTARHPGPSSRSSPVSGATEPSATPRRSTLPAGAGGPPTHQPNAASGKPEPAPFSRSRAPSTLERELMTTNGTFTITRFPIAAMSLVVLTRATLQLITAPPYATEREYRRRGILYFSLMVKSGLAKAGKTVQHMDVDHKDGLEPMSVFIKKAAQRRIDQQKRCCLGCRHEDIRLISTSDVMWACKVTRAEKVFFAIKAKFRHQVSFVPFGTEAASNLKSHTHQECIEPDASISAPLMLEYIFCAVIDIMQSDLWVNEDALMQEKDVTVLPKNKTTARAKVIEARMSDIAYMRPFDFARTLRAGFRKLAFPNPLFPDPAVRDQSVTEKERVAETLTLDKKQRDAERRENPSATGEMPERKV